MEIFFPILGAPIALCLSMALRRDTYRWALPALIVAMAFNTLMLFWGAMASKDGSKSLVGLSEGVWLFASLPLAIAVWNLARKRS